MIYRDFQGDKLSMLGFGTMRLPTREDGKIDEEKTAQMVKVMMDAGVNYFDTACPYHGGHAEEVIGQILSQYPRDSFYLADKFPGHEIRRDYDPKTIFEDQLRKCRVDYFDYYLLHNVYEKSYDTYKDEKWNILPYFLEQKRLGRIRHLGFSSHADVDWLRVWLDEAGQDMEFCQIQLNYLDWTLQKAREKTELLKAHNIPVWVMEPVRGGMLCTLDDETESALRTLRPDHSIPAWGFRFLQGVDGVTMILSGMSNMEQTCDNLKTFETEQPLNQDEIGLLLTAAEKKKNSVPCTGCRYCAPHCPKKLDIPKLMGILNELRVTKALNIGMRIEALDMQQRPESCIGCGACARMCPQNIDIPARMKELVQTYAEMPRWQDVCRKREEDRDRENAEKLQ